MAEEKNKSSKKKVESDKTNDSKKNKKTSKNVENKKKIVKKHSESSEKKVEHKKKNLEGNNIEKESNSKTNLIIIGLLVVIFLMMVGIGYLYMHYSNANSNLNENNNNNNNLNNINDSNNEQITLTIIEDPSCKTCNVDEFAKQIRLNLIPNLIVKKISIDSDEGKKAIKELKITQVPVYLFSENIDKRSDWATKLAGAFNKINFNSKNEYMLKPQYVPEKVMIVEPKILDNAVVYGNPNATVTIYEFSDYECPFCGIAEGNKDLVAQFKTRQPNYVPPMPEVYKNYIDTGKVKLVFYNMPLTQLHPRVRPAHIAALCANEQGKWVEFHHKLFADRSDWTSSDDYVAKMEEYAKDLGLNTEEFNKCMTSGKFDKQIDSELAYGASLGVSGTPAFFIGKNFISGAQDYSTFKNIIDAQLNSSN